MPSTFLQPSLPVAKVCADHSQGVDCKQRSHPGTFKHPTPSRLLQENPRRSHLLHDVDKCCCVKTNQRRKQDKTRSTQKKMQEPEVPAFYFICLGVPPPLTTDEGQWPGGGCLTSFSFCTCPLYFTWVFLSYLMPSHFIGIFSLGPSILFYFFRGSTPPGNRRGCIYIYIYHKYIYIIIYYIIAPSLSLCFSPRISFVLHRDHPA